MCDVVVLPFLSAVLGPGSAAAGAYAGMSSLAAAGMWASVGSTAMSVGGAYSQASAQKQVAQNNATVAEYHAQDALRRGEEEANATKRHAAALKSTQRVGLAAHGLDLSYGTAADIQDQTEFFGQVDADTARYNASKEAWGHRAQGAGYSAEARASKPWLTAGSTLLAGAGRVADRWSSYTGATPGLSYESTPTLRNGYPR